jgi:hypothetical protein
MHDSHFAFLLRNAKTEEVTPEILAEAADRVDRFNRLSKLIGLLAPGGTAPRTAFEEIYRQSGTPDVGESPVILDLRHMLHQHWGEWTPALREAEGLPPAEPDAQPPDVIPT